MTPRLASVFCALMTAAALAADPRAPAEFRITNTVVHPDPGPFTATIGDIPGDRQLFRGGSFEPLVFRTKVRAEADSPDEIVLRPTHGQFFGTFRTGFWNGAEVRVYRARNGRLVKVREGRVAEYVASGWLPVREMRDRLVAPPGKATEASGNDILDLPLDPEFEDVTFQKAIADDWRPDATYWFSVRAVTKDGRESPSSDAASIKLTSRADKGAGPQNIFSKFEKPKSIPDGPPVPAPKKLRAAISESCLVTLTWRGMKAAKLAGYRVYVSEDAPDRQRGNHIRLAGDGPPIRQGDMVFVCHQVTNFSRTRDVHGFRWGAGSFGRGAYTLIRDYSDEMANGRWERVPHPGALPKEFADGGETCLKLDLEDGAPFTIGMYSYAGTSQSWYPVLQPGRTYVAEGWVRYVGQGAGKLTFALRGHYDRKPPSQGGVAPVTYQATREWTRFRTTFSPGFLMESGGVGRMEFAFTGPGTFWVDNLRIYPEKPGYLRPEPLVVQRTRESGLDAIRFHTHIKSGWGQTMVMLTDPPGVMGCRGHDRPNSPFTLPALLDFCRTGGANPWLQVEMSMSEREWLGLVEYLAAPYNPATDTPEAKPWAFKRFRQGQPKPWTDEFERVYFEISNETWNGLFGPWTFGWGETMTDQATGKTYRYGELYGLFQEYVLGVLRSSPHWTSGMAGKFRSVMGGWAVSRGVDGYGGLAIRHSPSTDYLTIGGYNGGWDEGEKPAEPTNEGFFRAITFWLQNEERTREHLLTRETLVKQALAHRYAFGTYEAGPGYALSGLNKQARMTREQVEAQDQVGKSLANGVATLDAFLGRAQLGFTIQNFFTLNFKRSHWTSHAPVYKGGQPYPSWMALALYNNHGTGDFLATEALSAPTRDLSGYKRRRAREDAPLVAVYATRQGRRVNVFVLSRKLDGYPDPRDDGFTPVTLRLPFTRAGSVTLMKMAGDPRAHNLDEWVVQVQKKEGLPFAAPFRLTRATTDEAKDGLPPGSVLLYIFEGTDAAPAQMPSTPQSSRQRDT